MAKETIGVRMAMATEKRQRGSSVANSGPVGSITRIGKQMAKETIGVRMVMATEIETEGE